MTRTRGWSGRRSVLGTAAAAVLVAAVLMTGTFLTDRGAAERPARSGVESPAVQGTSTTPSAPAEASAGRFLPPAPPVRLRISSIDVNTVLVRLGLRGDGSMEVPAEYSVAGWYVHAPTPGEKGPAIVAGHVNSREGPAVFYRLGEVRRGDRVRVVRRDGSVVDFKVQRVERYPKDAFPTQQVYGDIDHAGLRLITCGGAFNEQTGHYRDNIVVYAAMARTR